VTQGLEIARDRGIPPEEIHGQLALARVLLGFAELGEPERVEDALTQASTLAGRYGAKAFEPLIHVERAELARQTGDQSRRERELREAHRLFAEIGATGWTQRLARDHELGGALRFESG
jgi:hypothetical protein